MMRNIKTEFKKMSGKTILFLICINIFVIMFTIPTFARENYEISSTSYSTGDGVSTGYVSGSHVPLTSCAYSETDTCVAEAWKVTLYVGKSNTVKLTDAPTSSNYSKETIIFLDRGFSDINDDKSTTTDCSVYIGNADKISYYNGTGFSPKNVGEDVSNNSYANGQKIIIDSKVPRLNIGTGQHNNSKNAINFFLEEGNDRSWVLSKFSASVSDEIPWCLVLEPMMRVYIQTEDVVLYYTATEYAYSQTFDDTGSGYYDYCFEHQVEPYTFYNLPNYYGLSYGWLGLPDSSGEGFAWTGIPDTVFYTRGSDERTAAENYIKSNWNSIKKSIINYGGCAMYCSPYFDNSDYTLSTNMLDMEKFENETVTLKIKVNRTIPEKEGTVNVTLHYNAEDCTIDGAKPDAQKGVTKQVTFKEGDIQEELEWEVQVGTYGADVENRVMNYTLTIIPEEGTTDIDTTNNELTGTIKLKRDFQVTSVVVDKRTCFENENVEVKFSVKNANPYRAYSNIPVSVYFLYGQDEVKIGTVVINKLDKEQTKDGSCIINVGNVTENANQEDSVVVTVNSANSSASKYETYTEPYMSNNIGVANVKVKRDINLSVSIVYREKWGNPIGNAPSKVKNTGSTQAVTTCVVSNHSRFNLYKDNPMEDVVTVTFYVNNKEIGSKSVPVPRYGSNLVWFKWDVPEGSSVTLRAELKWNIDMESAASPYDDNVLTKQILIDTVKEYETPDPDPVKQREPGTNSNYSNANGYGKITPSIAKWSEWICDKDGVFTRIDYAMTGDSALTLTPDTLAQNSNGSTIIAGSGFEAVFSYTVRTECSEAGYDVKEGDYTYAQNVVATFPEFQYSAKGDCRTMYLVKEDGDLSKASFRLEPNVYDKENKNAQNRRLHFTPYNMPDGEYKVGVVASQMWTPAGPIYVNASSSLMINGVMTDEFFSGGSVKQG